jgi:hypothetical protein
MQASEADFVAAKSFKMISSNEAMVRKVVGAMFFAAGVAVMSLKGYNYLSFALNYLLLAIGVMVYRMGVCSQ